MVRFKILTYFVVYGHRLQVRGQNAFPPKLCGGPPTGNPLGSTDTLCADCLIEHYFRDKGVHIAFTAC